MICSECKTNNPDNAIFCRGCGKKIETEEISPIIETKKEAERGICQNCGTKNPEDALFCNECGNKINELGEQNLKIPNRKYPSDLDTKCPYCNKRIKSGVLKCKYCGEWVNSKRNHLYEENLEFSYVLPLTHLILFSIVTLGIYGYFYWFYRNWKHLKAHNRLEISPGWRTIGLFVPIVNIVMIYGQFKDIKDFAKGSGVNTYSSPGSLVLGFIILGGLTSRIPDPWWIITEILSFLIIVYVQNILNEYWSIEQQKIPIKRNFTGIEIILMSIGGLFLVFLIFISVMG